MKRQQAQPSARWRPAASGPSVPLNLQSFYFQVSTTSAPISQDAGEPREMMILLRFHPSLLKHLHLEAMNAHPPFRLFNERICSTALISVANEKNITSGIYKYLFQIQGYFPTCKVSLKQLFKADVSRHTSSNLLTQRFWSSVKCLLYHAIYPYSFITVAQTF